MENMPTMTSVPWRVPALLVSKFAVGLPYTSVFSCRGGEGKGQRDEYLHGKRNVGKLHINHDFIYE